jgi:hypothetical protein
MFLIKLLDDSLMLSETHFSKECIDRLLRLDSTLDKEKKNMDENLRPPDYNTWDEKDVKIFENFITRYSNVLQKSYLDEK